MTEYEYFIEVKGVDKIKFAGLDIVTNLLCV